MKNFFKVFCATMVLMLFIFAGLLLSAELKKPAIVTTPEAKVVVVVTGWDAYKLYHANAKKEYADKKYVEASQSYLLAANQVGELKAFDVQAWMLNDIGDALIQKHKIDGDVSVLETAVKYLQQAKSIDCSEQKCKDCIVSNLSYCEIWLNKIVEKKEITKEAVKEVKKVVTPEAKKK